MEPTSHSTHTRSDEWDLNWGKEAGFQLVGTQGGPGSHAGAWGTFVRWRVTQNLLQESLGHGRKPLMWSVSGNVRTFLGNKMRRSLPAGPRNYAFELGSLALS